MESFMNNIQDKLHRTKTISTDIRMADPIELQANVMYLQLRGYDVKLTEKRLTVSLPD